MPWHRSRADHAVVIAVLAAFNFSASKIPDPQNSPAPVAYPAIAIQVVADVDPALPGKWHLLSSEARKQAAKANVEISPSYIASTRTRFEVLIYVMARELPDGSVAVLCLRRTLISVGRGHYVTVSMSMERLDTSSGAASWIFARSWVSEECRIAFEEVRNLWTLARRKFSQTA